MTKREWITAGVVCTFLISILAFAIMAQPTRADTRIGPEAVVSSADVCPT